ncbi:DUF1810 domain-containing protein [candidate division KSB1 bacterium]|nr:DUF1810 domain-containing protein [candidate division KSB1 bacterium]
MGKTDFGTRDDRFQLKRFIDAQERVYNRALDELRHGRKQTHWMWYIFPQVDGLGFSATSEHYAIKSIEEASQYLQHPILGLRLKECTEAVLAVEERSASDIFGYPDILKLKSSMTLFAYVAGDPKSVFMRVLEKYFHGEQDTGTLDLLENLKI